MPPGCTMCARVRCSKSAGGHSFALSRCRYLSCNTSLQCADVDGQPLHTYTIITVDATQGPLAQLHCRMPALLPDRGAVQEWLERGDAGQVRAEGGDSQDPTGEGGGKQDRRMQGDAARGWGWWDDGVIRKIVDTLGGQNDCQSSR